MDRQEVCAHREATALWLQPLRSPVLLAPSATALASAALRSVPAVQRGNQALLWRHYSHMSKAGTMWRSCPLCELTCIFPCQILLLRFQQHLTFRTLFVRFLLHRRLGYTCSEWGRSGTLYLEGGSPSRALPSWNFSASRKHLTVLKMILKYIYWALFTILHSAEVQGHALSVKEADCATRQACHSLSCVPWDTTVLQTPPLPSLVLQSVSLHYYVCDILFRLLCLCIVLLS